MEFFAFIQINHFIWYLLSSSDMKSNYAAIFWAYRYSLLNCSVWSFEDWEEPCSSPFICCKFRRNYKYKVFLIFWNSVFGCWLSTQIEQDLDDNLIPSEGCEGGSLEFSLWFTGKRRKVMCLSVTSFSAHTIGARGLNFGRNNHHIGGSKSTYQIFDILPRSWDIFSSK